jgi:hypothetical protein
MLRLLLKRWNKLLSTDLIKLHNYILNKKKLSYQCKESIIIIIIIPVCKKVNKTQW